MEKGILIEPVINDQIHGIAIQAKKFSLNLKISNHFDDPSEKFTISSIVISSESGQNLEDDFGKKTFFVDVINPGNSIIIKIGENGLFIRGLVGINMLIKPNDVSKQIVFLQKNPFTKEITKIGINKWADFFYMKSSSEYRQEISTKWIITLTWATAFFALIQVISILFFR